MGPLSLINPVNLIKATPGMSLIMGKIFFLFTEVVTETEFAQIPALTKDIDDNNATKFQVVVRGDVAKPLTLVKSFKWLALQTDIDKAQEHVSLVPSNTKIPEEYLNITSLDKEEIKTQVKDAAKKQIEETINNSVSEETKQQIQQTQEAATKIKNILSNKESIKSSLKERAQQAKQNAINQLKQDLQSTIETNTQNTNSTQTE